MSPVIDFSNVKGLDPLPVGEYLARVVEATEGLSGRSQQPKIDYRMEIIAPAEYAGRQVFDTLSFHPDAMYRVKQKLIGFGYGKDFSGEVNAATLIGKEAAITIEIEPGQPIPEDQGGDGTEAYPDRNRVRKVRKAELFGKANNQAAQGLADMSVQTPAPETTGRTRRK